jgi:uncharacterized paraquat-inducible protein A
MTPVAQTTRDTPVVCACGQDLDGLSRSHCPRCGCELRAR